MSVRRKFSTVSSNIASSTSPNCPLECLHRSHPRTTKASSRFRYSRGGCSACLRFTFARTALLKVVRLVTNVQAAELKYWEDTGIYPIMHTVVIRREVCDANPWVPKSLLQAFTAAKDNSLARALTFGSSYPIPMHAYYALDAQKRIGKDFFPFGIEPNRVTLEAFLKFCHVQGVCHRPMRPEELFAPQVIR